MSQSYTSPFPSVKTTIIYEQWDGRDNAIEVDRESIDLTPLLDARALEDIPDVDDYESTDEFFYEAEVDDLRTRLHDGPFTVNINEEDLTAYLEARGAANKTAALRTLPLRSTRARKTLLRDVYETALGNGGLVALQNLIDEKKTDQWLRELAAKLGPLLAEGQDELLDRDILQRATFGTLAQRELPDEQAKQQVLALAKRIGINVADRIITLNKELR